MIRVTLAFAACCIASSATWAQTPLKKWPVSKFEESCRANQAGRGFPPENCNRTSIIARARYGNEVTIIQWNSAVGVVRNQLRQGK